MHAMAISAMLSALLAFLVASFFATNAKVLFLYVFMAFSYCLAKVLVPSIDVVRRPRHRGASPRRSGPAPRMTAPVQADPS